MGWDGASSGHHGSGQVNNAVSCPAIVSAEIRWRIRLFASCLRLCPTCPWYFGRCPAYLMICPACPGSCSRRPELCPDVCPNPSRPFLSVPSDVRVGRDRCPLSASGSPSGSHLSVLACPRKRTIPVTQTVDFSRYAYPYPNYA